MLNQLLNVAPDVFKSGLLTFVLGLLVTFFGITVIVICVSIAGKIFNKTNNEPKEKVKKEEVKIEPVKNVETDDVPDTIKAAIIAAISAYYFTGEEPKSKCDFIVKRIKRI